jgi:WXG100 family type VII secretion target
MTDEIKMDYGLMQDMARTFSQGVEQLQDTIQAMMSVANEIEDGALLGKGGQAFTDAIQSKLCPAISRLTDKFQELNGDVMSAMQDMQEADDTSEGMF